MVIVLDTTVLAYAVGTEHPLREPSRRLLKALGEGTVTASTTVDVIQEFAHGYARRRPRADAAAQARRYATLLAPLLSPTEADLAAGLQLFEKQERLDAFDAVLAATTIAHEAKALVSADRAFASVRRLPFVELGSPEFNALLA
ncbi:MAG: type II toxin-antitoxin system VapC family toxin [Actinobacteria bacterium]|nr:MAG: type II toxin-antitoxin system VapC family toxin [Actinomycetota bacterium]